jgi:DNA-directed RNA polymerase specialized sigma24 family protein
MDGSTVYKKDWVVTQASFDRLLQQLDPDRERAGERYLQIREKLVKFFQWRGSATPEDFADRTIDRVARRIEEGVEIHAQNVYLFFHGVAVNVLREYWKEAQKFQAKPLDDMPEPQDPAENPVDASQSAGQRELQMQCLDGCVERLPVDQIALITRYHQDQGGAKIAQRNELAKELKIPLNALRIRAFRIRGELETCISECVRRETL